MGKASRAGKAPGAGLGSASGDSQYDARTVLCKNVAQEVDQARLSEVFSDVGPVRQVVLVGKGGSSQGKHRGLGFVKFALAEDAARAIQSLNKTELGGKQLCVEAALHRPSFEERRKRKAEWKHQQETGEYDEDDGAAQQAQATTAPRAKRLKILSVAPTDKKHGLLSAVAVGNLTKDTMQQAIRLAKRAGKHTRLDKIVPEELANFCRLRADGCQGAVIMVHYASPKVAAAAVHKLHGHPLKRGNQPAGAAPDVSGGVALWARAAAGPGAYPKRWRVILRNLPFSATETSLRELLAPTAFVWELTLPLKDGRLRGFGFASFTNKQDAVAAIAAVNGTVLGGRTLVADWAVSKAVFEAGGAGAEPEGAEEESGSDSEPERDLEGEEEEREGSESEEDFEAERQKSHHVLASIIGSGEGEQQTGPTSSSEAAPAAVSDDDSEGSDGAVDATEAPTGAAPAPRHADQEVPVGRTMERTVFVRGLPLDVTPPSLQAKLELYGPVTSCRLVRDKQTSLCKGTAFVEFKEGESAARAAAACERGRKAEGPGIVLGGLTLQVDVAFTKEGARTYAVASAGEKGADRRHLHLAKEGHFPEDGAAWQGMSAGDQAKRKRAASEAASKLKSPNFHVSMTRLCVRNVPGTISEAALRVLVVAAIKQRATQAKPVVKQCKLLKDNTRTGEAPGQGRSKGIAFVELAEHEHALVALRQLNNNPAAFSQEHRPIVEFAIENSLKMREREKRAGAATVARDKARMLAAAEALEAGGEGEAAGDGDPAEARKAAKRERAAKRVLAQERLAAKQQRKRDRGEEVGGGGAGFSGAEDVADKPVSKKARQGKPGDAKPHRRAAAASEVPSNEAPGVRPQSRKELGRQRTERDRESHAKRKRADDAAVDAAAGAGGDGPAARQPRKGGKAEKADDELDGLVAKYTQKIKGGASGGAAVKASLSRWFE